MSQNLKVGQSFEVVEVLMDGGYFNVFKVTGFTIGIILGRGIDCLPNGNTPYSYEFKYMSLLDKDIKPIGKLTITKLK